MSTINKEQGKYIGYMTSLESSTIVWAENIEDIKAEWSFGVAIFESNGITKTELKKAFPEPPERGVILEYLKDNLKCVYRTGAIIGEQDVTRKVHVEKMNKPN